MELVKTAPARRVLFLQGHTRTLVLEQKVKENLPFDSTVKIGTKRVPVPDRASVHEIENLFHEEIELCTVRWLPDMEVVFRPKLRTPPQFRDLKSGEDVEAAKSQARFARMDTTALWTKLEQIYLPISNHFSDPYQYEDNRKETLQFRTGDMDELDFGITMLLHAFPKLYQRALATGSVEARLPRVFVYSVFAHKPVQFQFRLWEPERVWSCDSRFEAMLSQIVEENTPVGSRYVNPVPGLCRRSRFVKGSIIIPIIPDTPSDVQILFARQFLQKHCGKHMNLSPAFFDSMPLL
jgi:hypothetical protein